MSNNTATVNPATVNPATVNSGLAVEQVSGLTPEQVSGLTPEQVSALVKPEQVSAVSIEAYGKFTPAQVSGLTPEQVSIVSKYIEDFKTGAQTTAENARADIEIATAELAEAEELEDETAELTALRKANKARKAYQTARADIETAETALNGWKSATKDIALFATVCKAGAGKFSNYATCIQVALVMQDPAKYIGADGRDLLKADAEAVCHRLRPNCKLASAGAVYDNNTLRGALTLAYILADGIQPVTLPEFIRSIIGELC